MVSLNPFFSIEYFSNPNSSLTLTHLPVPPLRVHLLQRVQLPNRQALKFGVCAVTISLVLFTQLCSRRAVASQVAKPNSSRAAGAGGSSSTMLKLYTDDSPGLRVCVHLFVYAYQHRSPFSSDPFIVLVLSLSFIASIFFLHISAKIIRAFTK